MRPPSFSTWRGMAPITVTLWRTHTDEFMLDVIGAGATATADHDWHKVWKNTAAFDLCFRFCTIFNLRSRIFCWRFDSLEGARHYSTQESEIDPSGEVSSRATIDGVPEALQRFHCKTGVDGLRERY
ncbi:hypothetical protein BT96DRAFT_1003134 [Gymnopus androsaceus JB14]|uniref:Uncharacterized protein n=1 Tax=Gymnopus androsaceus JB14 TaxID=1447944 RepID=A0A6A4GVN2_9AGAR|nr:hypothetical protein BT96DRAFT_1003134 [Gymnopus androsaceus JB14]